jgi:translocation and assembly module TamB
VAFAGIGEDRASGRYIIDLTLAGALDDPSITGSASVENGRYENFASGAILRDISLQATGASDRLELALTATDGEGGRIEGGGVLRLDGVSLAALDLTARLTDFRAIRRDDVRARATGALALAGPFDELTLSGRVRLEHMTVHLPERSPVAAPKLDVIEVNAATGGIVEPIGDAGQGRATRPADVEVVGRGLKSQWRGELDVGGTTVEPRIRGKMHLHRGNFTALSKTFTLTEGEILFDGGPKLDPSLRVVAEREVRDAVARATLTGSLSSPLLEFSARPELPVDEVLARLLFDKGAGQVGAAEALQLAQVAATLREGGTSTGVVEQIGQKLGLDVDVSTVKTKDKETGETGEAAALSIGKNIGEDVQVGVEQGIEAGTGGMTMEVDLDKNLSVKSRVSPQGRSGIGLKWEYDY